jgi:Tfp pilus assembly protein PilF
MAKQRSDIRSLLALVGMGLLLLGGCRTINLDLGFDQDEAMQAAIINQDRDNFPDIDPLYINAEIKELIDSHINREDGEEVRVGKLQDLLYGEKFLNVQYSDKKTHTALEAFYAREGNCLSIMNLYVAIARYAQVDANFQTVDVQPSWDRRGDLLVLSQHINATGRISVRRHYIVDFTPEIALQQLTSNVITDLEARALYFNNLGVEALIAESHEQALVYFRNSLFLDPNSSITWNNIGSTFNLMGNSAFAEFSYRKAFSMDNKNATAINNLAKFYRRAGDMRRAHEYELAIERFNNLNPYFHFAQGNVALAENDLAQARLSFRRALKLKEEEPDFYFALARVNLVLGNEREAQRFVDSANQLLARNEEIYRPSSQRVRIIDSSTILRESSPGISIIAPGGAPSGSRN